MEPNASWSISPKVSLIQFEKRSQRQSGCLQPEKLSVHATFTTLSEPSSCSCGTLTSEQHGLSQVYWKYQ